MAVACVAVSALGACGLITEPLPKGAERFTPPAVYAHWWKLTETCSGRSGDLNAVTWYQVPGSKFVIRNQSVPAYWSSSNRIVIAETLVEHGPMVRHEMLHALLRIHGHARSEFLDACGSLVVCQGTCIDDAGRWQLPQQSYVILPPESLSVASRAELRPRESDGQRWLDLEVTVRNPRGHTVLVAAPGDPVTPPTFGYELRGPSARLGGQVAIDSSTLFFKPLETKQWLFEFRVTLEVGRNHIQPGTYVARGRYARHYAAADDTLAVIP